MVQVKHGEKHIINICIIFSITLICIFHIQSLFSICMYFLGALLFNRLFLKENTKIIVRNFTYYLTWTLIIYAIQFIVFPKTIGLTPGQLIPGGGTDDVYFYGQAALDFPSKFPFRGSRGGEFNTLTETYAKILRLLSAFFHQFFANNPLDLLGFNVAFLTFLPIYMCKTLDEIVYVNKEYKIWLSNLLFVCPFIISNGCVLLRDGIITVLFCMIIYFYMREDYRKIIVPIAFISCLRLGTALIIIISLLIAWFFSSIRYLSISKIVECILIIGIGAVVLSLFSADLEEYVLSKMGGNTFFRSFLVEAGSNTASSIGINSEFFAAAKLPLFFRIPFLSIITFVAPMFETRLLVIDNVFIVRNLLLDIIYPMIFSFTLCYFFSGIVYLYKNHKSKIPNIYLCTLILTAVISLQIRHKTMIMPLYYLICVIGKKYCIFSKYSNIAIGIIIFLTEIVLSFV